MKEIKWSQWSPDCGMIRCGFAELPQLMKWMTELGRDASRCLKSHDKPHAIYGRKMYTDGKVSEIRFYTNTYATDEELDKLSRDNPHDLLYVAHR